MAQRRTTQEQLDAARKELEQKEIRIKDLLKRQKKEERKARTHRLCERGGLVEKLMPDLIRLTTEQFEVFVEKALLTGYAAKILSGLLPPPAKPQDDTETAPDGGATAEARNPASPPNTAQKPAGTAQGTAAGTAQSGGNSAAQGASPIH